MKPLSPLEKELKRICATHPEKITNSYVTKEQLDDIMRIIDLDLTGLPSIPLDESLTEDELFLPRENVGIVEHARYLPPLLHDHVFFELAYCRDGSCIHFLDGNAHKLSKGDIVIIAPKHQHAISAFTDEADIINLQMRTSTFENYFFSVLSGKDVLSDFFTHALYSVDTNACITFRTGEDPMLLDISHQLQNEYNYQRKYRGRMLDSLISVFIIQLLREHEKDVVTDPNTHSPREDNLVLMLQYIQNNYSHLSLTELADFFGYSTRHVTRLLKEHTGKNFAEITKELRMKKAADLLTKQDMPISSIMEICGYSDMSTFYKAFKSYYNATPAEYRH